MLTTFLFTVVTRRPRVLLLSSKRVISLFGSGFPAMRKPLFYTVAVGI